MPLSSDPDARRRQLENLTPRQSPTHGSYSGALIREATVEHLANLADQFPTATRVELTLQASRMAMIERLTDYVHQRGLIRNQRSGTVVAAADLLAKLSLAFERQHAILLQRELANASAGVDTIESIARELNAGRDGGDQ